MFRLPGVGNRRLHIEGAINPTRSACARLIEIQLMEQVPVTQELLLSFEKGKLCQGCIAARPERFPNGVVEAHARGRTQTLDSLLSSSDP